jgi:hypothetical protein
MVSKILLGVAFTKNLGNLRGLKNQVNFAIFQQFISRTSIK